MGLDQAHRYCRDCGRKTLHARPSFGGGMGLLLTILTAGLFLPVWFLIKVHEAIFSQYRCQACGKARLV